MARKRPIEETPPAVSSSEEEETDDEEEEQQPLNGTVETQQNGAGEIQNDDEEGSEDEEDEDEEEKEKPNLPPSKSSKSNSESDSETDSADTESTHTSSSSLSGFTIKPISPKRKPGRKPEQPKQDGDDKKAKRGAGTGGGGSQRLWSDEDEIGLLIGLIEYQNDKGKNPFADTGDFRGFVKESLHVDATNNQFVNKIRRLKKKYFTDVEKNENGKDEIFSQPHDLECVELAEKIWGAGGLEVGKKGNSTKTSGKIFISGGGGGGGGITLALAKRGSEEANGEKGKVSVKKGKMGLGEEVNAEGKEGNLKKQSQGSNEDADGGEERNVKKGKRVMGEEVNGEGKGKGGTKEKRAADEESDGEGEEVNVIVKKQKKLVNEEMNGEGMELSVMKQKAVANEEVDGEGEGSKDLWDKYPYLRSSLDGENLPEDVKKRTMVMLRMVREEKLVELEREWRSLTKSKLESFIKQKDLIAKQIKLSLDAMKSQDS